MSDKLPQKICLNCMNQVILATEIKHKVIETEEILREKIKDESLVKIEQDELADYSLFTSETHLSEQFLDVNDTEPLETEAFIKIRRRSQRSDKNLLAKEINKSERKNKTPNEMDYKCFICDESFDKIWTKNKHVKVDHKNERVCKICNTKCKTPISLETHVKFHFRDYGFMCEICSKTFRYRNRLNSHMALHHAKAAEMICDLCGLSTKFKNNIKRHMKSVHMKLREFQCDQCSGSTLR